jgi:hypothetical protein
LEKNQDKIDWELLSSNPNAIHILEENMDKIDWDMLSENPNIFELDYHLLKERCSIYKSELLMKSLHRYLDLGMEIEWKLNSWIIIFKYI